VFDLQKVYQGKASFRHFDLGLATANIPFQVFEVLAGLTAYDCNFCLVLKNICGFRIKTRYPKGSNLPLG
jgi:hypothetical protein